MVGGPGAHANMALVPVSPVLGRVGRYELLEEVGRRMTSVVYRAADPDLGRTVAVKVIDLPSHVSDAERQALEKRILDQARLAGRLSHPGLVVTHDAGMDAAARRLFVVFEYVEGETLAAALSAGAAFEWRAALRLVARVAEALDHMHGGGVVHRDLRPANIMVLPSGDPKLMDVGVARLETGRMTLTSIREAFGMPLYMSPEQAVGESVDARTDIFSLGAVAYRLLTGLDAFAAADPREILARVVHQTPPPPSSLDPRFPPGVDEMIAHALAKSRKDRYEGARSLAEDVEDLLAGRPPRHSEGRAVGGGTERFHVALAASALSIGSESSPGGRSATHAESTLVGRRRPIVRSLAGAAALALVLAVELLRRGETFSPPVPTPTAAAPVVSPRTSRIARPAPVLDPALPSVNQLAPDAARAGLSLDLRHTLKSGRLRVFVDGDKVLDRWIAARPSTSVLGAMLREGRVRGAFDIRPGRRQVRVEVLWDDEWRAKTIVGTFKAGASRRLSARLGRVGKGLVLEWQ